MTNATSAFGRRDEFGFLTPRIAKLRKPTRVIWLAVGLAVTWVSACSLALAISLGSVS